MQCLPGDYQNLVHTYIPNIQVRIRLICFDKNYASLRLSTLRVKGPFLCPDHCPQCRALPSLWYIVSTIAILSKLWSSSTLSCAVISRTMITFCHYVCQFPPGHENMRQKESDQNVLEVILAISPHCHHIVKFA